MRVMRVVRGHDGDGFDAVGPCPFAIEHFRDIAVASLGGDAQRGPGTARTRRIARENAGDDAPAAVELGCRAVHVANPNARTAADDAEPERPAEALSQFRHRLPSFAFFATRSISADRPLCAVPSAMS